MLTDKQITALLIRADNAVARAQGFDWAPMRPADVEDMASTIRRLQGLLANAAQENLICSCGEARTFNLSGHIDRVEKRGDIRNEFARQAALSETHNARG